MALEAMACGLPVIVSDHAALADVVRSPRAGLAVRTSDTEAFARAIGELLANVPLRRAMGIEGRRIVESEHSYDQYVDRHLALYESLVPGTSRKG
jgi:glycosyltransferase involved in cell wall biosynthesis